MSERNAPRVYGLRVGLVSGLFSIGQVAISSSAAHGSEASLRAIQRAFAILAAGGIADPTMLIAPLLPMLAATYLSMLLVGLLTLWFAREAGQMSAIAQGRHDGGATAGMWVWLTSTMIWMAASVVAVALTKSDGTISGVFTGTFTTAYLPQEVLFLLLQEALAALICLGFCALAGSRGARNAALVSPEAPPTGMPAPVGFPLPGAYPYAPYQMPGYPAGYPGYQGYPTYPVYPAQQPYQGYPGYPAGWPPAPVASPAPTTASAQQAGAPDVYPPPPTYYMPQPTAPTQSEPPAPQPE